MPEKPITVKAAGDGEVVFGGGGAGEPCSSLFKEWIWPRWERRAFGCKARRCRAALEFHGNSPAGWARAVDAGDARCIVEEGQHSHTATATPPPGGAGIFRTTRALAPLSAHLKA